MEIGTSGVGFTPPHRTDSNRDPSRRPSRRHKHASLTEQRGRFPHAFLANPIALAAILIGAAFTLWIVTVDRMAGMDAGPGTDLGGLGWYVGLWITMMAAMMLPSVAPMVVFFARVSDERHRQGRAAAIPTWIFLLAYLAVWAGYGLLAYGIFRLVDFLDPAFLAWDRAGPYVAGGTVAAAGLYQLSPLKEVCLRHCRGPLHFVLHGWREGRFGALRMGGEHGLYCVGCCWGLFLILFAVGVMSLFWMAVIAAVIFAEKVLPQGDRLSRLFAVAFVVLGVWIAAAPSTVPGLTEPSMGGMDETEMESSAIRMR